MQTDACQFFYECTGCGILLKPAAGDCCVFCSYGDTKCPPVQEGAAAVLDVDQAGTPDTRQTGIIPPGRP